MRTDPAAKGLTGRWVHSHEEDTADEAVYRPESYDFPRSRGRKAIQFLPDGTLTAEGIGPDDRPAPQQGSWHLQDPGTIEISYGSAAGGTIKMTARRAGPEKLIIEK